MGCWGNTVAASAADCHCVMHRLEDLSAEEYFFLSMQCPSPTTTDVTVEHVITDQDESQRYDQLHLITAPWSSGEINVSTTSRRFSLISFLWWWREALFYWHLNSRKQDQSIFPSQWNSWFWHNRTEVNRPHNRLWGADFIWAVILFSIFKSYWEHDYGPRIGRCFSKNQEALWEI